MFVGQLLAFATTSPVNGVLLWSVSFRPSPAILPLASRLSPLQPTPPPSLSLPPACSSAPLPPRRPLARALPGWRIVNAGKLADMAACRQSLSSTPALLHASHTTHHAPLATHRESVCKERESTHIHSHAHTHTRNVGTHDTRPGRCVAPSARTLSMALSVLAMHLLGDVPSPVVVGAMFEVPLCRL